jgi:hypothetical protein
MIHPLKRRTRKGAYTRQARRRCPSSSVSPTANKLLFLLYGSLLQTVIHFPLYRERKPTQVREEDKEKEKKGAFAHTYANANTSQAKVHSGEYTPFPTQPEARPVSGQVEHNFPKYASAWSFQAKVTNTFIPGLRLRRPDPLSSSSVPSIAGIFGYGTQICK